MFDVQAIGRCFPSSFTGAEAAKEHVLQSCPGVVNERPSYCCIEAHMYSLLGYDMQTLANDILNAIQNASGRTQVWLGINAVRVEERNPLRARVIVRFSEDTFDAELSGNSGKLEPAGKAGKLEESAHAR